MKVFRHKCISYRNAIFSKWITALTFLFRRGKQKVYLERERLLIPLRRLFQRRVNWRVWVYKRGKPLGEEGLLEFIREKSSLDRVAYQRIFMVFVLFLVVKSLSPIFICFVVSRKECVLKLRSMLKSKEGLLLKSAPLFLIHLSTWYRSVLFTC